MIQMSKKRYILLTLTLMIGGFLSGFGLHDTIKSANSDKLQSEQLFKVTCYDAKSGKKVACGKIK